MRAAATIGLAFSLAGCLLLDPWDAITPESRADAAADDAGEAGAGGEDGPSSDARVEAESPPVSVMPAQWMFDRGVWLGSCTGTRIAPRFVLTALRCLPTLTGEGGPAIAEFYSKGPAPDPTRTAQVVAVTSPPGTDVATADFTADGGDFADIAVVELDRDITFGASAVMSWTYPGSGALGYKVGVEPLNGSDKLGLLRAFLDATDSLFDVGGAFQIRHAYTDVGGAFYVSGGLLGVLSGREGALSRFTSMPRHLPWILDASRFRWPGGPPIAGRALTGGVSQTFAGTERVCQYACIATAACLGYDYAPASSLCTLHSSLSGSTAAPGAHYAVRWALRGGSARSGDPVGYIRSDDSSAVVHRLVAGGLGELRAVSAPAWTPTAVAGAGAGRPSVYVRSDGVDAVVYRDGANGHVMEQTFVGGAWTGSDLTVASGAPAAAGDPVAYVRADGVATVAYRTAGGHIVELKYAGTWSFRDLTALAAAPLAVADPNAFDRSSQYSSIFFRASNNHVYEIYQDVTGALGWGDPFAIAGLDVGVSGTPYGYVRFDGVEAIVYRATDGTIRELANLPTGWTRTTLDPAGILPAAGNPYAYVRSDGTSAVVFRSTTDRILEVARGGTTSWVVTDLTSGVAATPVGDPAAYVRADGVNAVLFRSADNHVWELTQSGASWTPADLTSLAGETP